jgi:hypothetical protein
VAAYVVASAVDSVTPFIGLLPPLGFFTNGVFALFTLWLPELFPTAQRSFGAGFAFSLGRVLGAIGLTFVGVVVAFTGWVLFASYYRRVDDLSDRSPSDHDATGDGGTTAVGLMPSRAVPTSRLLTPAP